MRNNCLAKAGLAGSAEPPLEDGNELQIQAEQQGKPVKEKLLPGISFVRVSQYTFNINYS